MSRQLVIAVAVALGAAACTGGGQAAQSAPEAPSSTTPPSATASPTTPSTTAPTTTAPTTTAPTTTAPTTTDPVTALLPTLTLEQKVGQLLMPVLSGTSATVVTDAEAAVNSRIGGRPTPAELVSAYHLGGVIYLGPNVESAEQLTELSAGLQAAAPPEADLLIAVDQEGGRVARVTDGVPAVPAARTLAGDADAVLSSSFVTAVRLGQQGINVVLAPVADLTDGSSGVIGDRSYSADPQVAAEMVTTAIRGLQLGGVAAVVKHWPGHGATTVDSHTSLPVIEVDRAAWESRERVPFAAAADEGVAAVMIGHLSLPGLDPSGRPATVSPVLVDDMLRADLGFDGVVMTDALDMGAVADIERAELVVQAIEAGVDILLAPPDLGLARQALLDALAAGRISEERLDASVTRVLRLKAELGLLPPT